MINSKSFVIFLLTCGLCAATLITPGCRNKVINPNGSSELAVHMRDLSTDVELIKEQVLAGKAITVKADPKHILHAEPTEAGKTELPDYITYAEAYIHSVEMLKNSSTEDARQYYTTMVNSCINCHKSMCPGPVVRIKKFHLKGR
ncbi:MAG: hypothetical protein GY751_11300 [Bacteroidetes bacterium]|nr:hypothetical protein [Bacteroidota bacterium]